jgi:hypothetical protein
MKGTALIPAVQDDMIIPLFYAARSEKAGGGSGRMSSASNDSY